MEKIQIFFKKIVKRQCTLETIPVAGRKSKMIGVVTDFGYKNFGNKLQNFALLKTLNGFGYNAINLTSIPTYRNQLIKNCFLLYYRAKNKFTEKTIKHKRNECIKKASLKYENRPFYYSYTKTDKKRLQKFYAIVFGSDQVWNLSYHHDREFVLGQFGVANETFKKISYAASIGSENIPEADKDFFRRSLKSFYRISCREESGTKSINNLGFKCVTTLDPTLLLSVQEWDEAIKRYSSRSISTNNYVLLYFLENNSEKAEIINDVENANINFVDITNEKSRFYISNQFDFINLIKNAKHIYTDSFHACVFSILFGKDFNVYPRTDNPKTDKMFTRIENLFDLFGIKIDLSLKNEFHSSDFTDLSKFNSLKKDSIQFLKDSIIE